MKTRFLILFVFITSVQGLLHGQTWKAASGLSNLGRVDDIAFVDSIGYFGANKKIYKTTNRGRNWSIVSQNAQLDYVRSIEMVDENIVFAGTLRTSVSGGLFKTENGGETWTKIPINADQEGICGLDYKHNTLIGVGTFADKARLYLSRDLGQTIQTIDLKNDLHGAVDCHIVDSLHFMVSGSSTIATKSRPSIIETRDGGATWKNLLYADEAGDGYVWKMHFLGDTILVSIQTGINNNNPNGKKIYLSKDLGATWSYQEVPEITSDQGGVILLPNGEGYIADQYQNNLVYTADYGQTWKVIADQPLKAINRIITLKDGTLIASGAGIFYTEQGTSKTEDNPSPPLPQFTISVFPNPIIDNNLNLELSAAETTQGLIEIFDAQGHKVYVGDKMIVRSGKTRVSINVSGYSSGIYYLLWKNNHQFARSSFVKMGS
jgi:photosystem II stability/assembly factor-like uncharacterized protein